MKIDNKELTLDERQVYLAAFGSAAAITDLAVLPGEASVPTEAISALSRETASAAVRAFRLAIAAGLLGVLAMLAGCSGVHVSTDAGAGDARLRNGCLDLFNTWQTYAPAGCEASSCPFSGPVSDAEIDACNETLYAAREECDAMQAALEACR